MAGAGLCARRPCDERCTAVGARFGVGATRSCAHPRRATAGLSAQSPAWALWRFLPSRSAPEPDRPNFHPRAAQGASPLVLPSSACSVTVQLFRLRDYTGGCVNMVGPTKSAPYGCPISHFQQRSSTLVYTQQEGWNSWRAKVAKESPTVVRKSRRAGKGGSTVRPRSQA